MKSVKNFIAMILAVTIGVCIAQLLMHSKLFSKNNSAPTTVTATATTTPASVSTPDSIALNAATNTYLTVANLETPNYSLYNINVPKLLTVASADGLKPKTLKEALNSYAWAREHHKLGDNKNTLTVVDFSLPSYKKRMWVIDLQSDKVLMKLYTTHGKGSGETYATRFSNVNNSEESSLGLYVTSDEYYGHHDKSMRIDGLEKGINSNARARDIVIHSASYATPQYIEEHHSAGRSWGCFAIAPSVKEKLLSYIKGGSALFTYAAPEDHDPIAKNGPITNI